MLASSLIEYVAAEARAKAGARHPAFSTHQIVQASFPTALVTGGKLPAGIDEMVSVRDGGPIIVYKRTLSCPEQRFAIAHAMAHLLFDDARVCAIPGRPGVNENEQQADEFAAELLAPKFELLMLVRLWPSRDPEEHEIYLDHVDELASTFGVPAGIIDSQIHKLLAKRFCRSKMVDSLATR